MAPSNSTQPTRVLILGTCGAGLSTLIAHLDYMDTTPTSAPYEVSYSARRFGKTEMSYAIELKKLFVKFKKIKSLLHYWFNYNPSIIRCCVGPIRRKLLTRSRPSVIRKRASRHDKLINKRKTWLRSL